MKIKPYLIIVIIFTLSSSCKKNNTTWSNVLISKEQFNITQNEVDYSYGKISKSQYSIREIVNISDSTILYSLKNKGTNAYITLSFSRYGKYLARINFIEPQTHEKSLDIHLKEFSQLKKTTNEHNLIGGMSFSNDDSPSTSNNKSWVDYFMNEKVQINDDQMTLDLTELDDLTGETIHFKKSYKIIEKHYFNKTDLIYVLKDINSDNWSIVGQKIRSEHVSAFWITLPRSRTPEKKEFIYGIKSEAIKTGGFPCTQSFQTE